MKRRLGEIAANDEAPWVKLGEAVFRVERIRDEGCRVVLDAMVRDPALARYLEGMRPDQWQRGEGVLLSTSDRCGSATVRLVASETRARSVRTIEIELEVSWSEASSCPRT